MVILERQTMRAFITILTITLLISCGRQDDFYDVTKLIYIPDTITIDRPFDFKLVLRNDSLKEMKFTIDDTVQKSVFFNLDFRCNDQFVRDEVKNPKNEKHNYKKYYLKNGDSLVYNLQGIFRQTGKELQMEIKGYDRIYRVEKTTCNNLTINFGGMWNPGDFNPLDAMEGYDFNKKITVNTTTIDKDY